MRLLVILLCFSLLIEQTTGGNNNPKKQAAQGGGAIDGNAGGNNARVKGVKKTKEILDKETQFANCLPQLKAYDACIQGIKVNLAVSTYEAQLMDCYTSICEKPAFLDDTDSTRADAIKKCGESLRNEYDTKLQSCLDTKLTNVNEDIKQDLSDMAKKLWDDARIRNRYLTGGKADEVSINRIPQLVSVRTMNQTCGPIKKKIPSKINKIKTCAEKAVKQARQGFGLYFNAFETCYKNLKNQGCQSAYEWVETKVCACENDEWGNMQTTATTSECEPTDGGLNEKDGLKLLAALRVCDTKGMLLKKFNYWWESAIYSGL